MSKKVLLNIGGRIVGEGKSPLVIAEIGINHEGSLKTAFELVDSAISAGAEVIKHQTHVVEDEMSSAAKMVIPGNSDVSIPIAGRTSFAWFSSISKSVFFGPI